MVAWSFIFTSIGAECWNAHDAVKSISSQRHSRLVAVELILAYKSVSANKATVECLLNGDALAFYANKL